MAPSHEAQDPTKQSAPLLHEDDRVLPEERGQLGSRLPPPSPAQPPQNGQYRRHTSYRPVHDAVHPQLSERDSIFATHYHTPPARSTTPIRSATVAGHLPPQASSMAAASLLRRTSVDASSALNKDLTPSAISLYHYAAQQQPHHDPRPSKTNPSRQYQHDPHDFGSPSFANLLQTIADSDSTLPQAPLRRNELPTTPDSSVKVIDYADLDQAAEREQYRSWRKGQAKMNGMTIAQSQRRSSQPQVGLDKVIDAQLPQPDPPMANARSRKASHYLGLFRENEAEERREHEKRRAEQIKGGDADTELQLVKDVVSRRKDAGDHKDSLAQDAEAIEDGNKSTISGVQTANKLPLGLLEEIRNHHHLAPGKAQMIPGAQGVPGRDADGHLHEHPRETRKSEDEDSDHEHISSATYYPHQGVAPADSPTEDQLADRKPQDELHVAKTPLDLSTNNVQLSLQSDSARDYLQGMSRDASVNDFQQLPQPALSPETPTEDSEYESDSYGYDSAVSEEEDQDVETTPTATPVVRAQRRASERKNSRQAPAPVGAVELKPYKHQVGGHTPVYRFSRRAVCKQLNSKENMFYETVEKNHPDLLGFMPRYIGVLNVTYRKEPRKRKPTDAQAQEDPRSKADSGQTSDVTPTADSTRMISHSMRGPQDVPQVIFENNRHLIPDSLFRVPPRSLTPDLHRTRSSPPTREHESDHEDLNGNPYRPSLKSESSWGFTSVNEQLRDRVLREVFTAPLIHKHDRRDRHYHTRSLQRRMPKYIQSRSSTGQQRLNPLDLGQAQSAEDPDVTESSHIPTRMQQTESDVPKGASLEVEHRIWESRNGLSKSAEASELDLELTDLPNRPHHHKRRHSGGGLTRKPVDIEGPRGDLEFHEIEDEAYTADADDVFSMDDVGKGSASKHHLTAPANCNAPQKVPDGNNSAPPEHQTASRLGPAIEFGPYEPRNPETSLVQMDERVVRFLLLEDLTAGMQKPCVLDLKMGTRVHGIEANEKKQASQRMKCKTTTSRELGVRVCGMQVYHVRDQKYRFEDKYTGRDFKAGAAFQAALTRFFHDGIGHAQALKHIPSILEKINQLDRIIRSLPGYRLYASSLLMIYDRGDADVTGKVQPEQDEDGRPAQYPDIKLKIVDFANCVTAEDMQRVLQKAAPPSNPDAVDRGYLRGLRTLRAYFQKIYQDLHRARYVERGEGEGMAMDQRGISNATTHRGWTDSIIDDPGEVSV